MSDLIRKLIVRRPAPDNVIRKPVDRAGERISTPAYFGTSAPDILFVVDPLVGKAEQEEAPNAKSPVVKYQREFIEEFCAMHSIELKRCAILRSCPPVTAEQWDSQKKLTTHLKEHRNEFVEHVQRAKPKIIVAMGKSAASQVLNRSAQITKLRGTPKENAEFKCLVYATLGINHVIRIPENRRTFDADIATLAKIIDKGYTLAYQTEIKQDYSWKTDIQFLLDKADEGPITLSVDCEWTGGEYYHETFKLLTVQISTGPGIGYAIPIEYNHKNQFSKPSEAIKARVVPQLKKLLEHKNVICHGQNFKGDVLVLKHKLNIKVRRYEDDTICLMHAVDENMLVKSLDEIVRVWVPDMAGYADDFNRDPVHKDKSRMDLVPPDKMVTYGCGDVDATFRAKLALEAELKKDPKAYNCYRRVTMPAMDAFSKIEDHGFRIDIKALRAFEKELRKHQKAEYQRLVRQVPAAIKREYLDPWEKRDRNTGKIIKQASLTRPGFLLQMIFFHNDGLRLEPTVFTKSTKNLKDPSQRIPSTSGKQHLAYFKDDYPFIADIMDYIKNEKLLGTYVGSEGLEDGDSISGFYKYIYNGRIRPTYWLSRAVTGRSASSNPNGQNFPKRGKLAKKYREIFVAPPGYVLIEVDQSQIELRVAAIMANDPTMLRLYREGADIHAATAAATMGITLSEFNDLPTAERDLKRFQAKAINFGFLYGMGWRKFIVYAKTEYGITFTEEEAQEIRNAFFRMYSNLKNWHVAIKNYVEEHGQVRAFDGRVRHLPSVHSPDESIAAAAVRQAVNSPVQAFGSDLGLMALALLVKNVDFKLVRPIGFIHDALVAIAPEGKAKEACAAIKYWMEHVPLEKWFGFKPPIPFIAEASVGKNLSDMTEIKDSWYADDNVITYYDIQLKGWEAKCRKADQLGEPHPPRPLKVNRKFVLRRSRPPLARPAHRANIKLTKKPVKYVIRRKA